MGSPSGAEEKEVSKDDESSNVLIPNPRPPSLQWVAVGKGGKVSSVRTVRSHVSKEHHQRQRESRNATQQRLKQQRRRLLRPTHIAPDEADGSSQEQETDAGTDIEHTLPETGRTTGGTVAVRRYSASLPPSATLHNQEANLIPYAWFERNGPVLYVNRSKWPFPAPLNVTGSDRTDLSPKSLTPRQSGWMPAEKRASDFTGVKGAVLDPNVLLWIGQSPECFQFRVETIKWIQDQLEGPVKAVSNTTIASVMTFAMWTAGYGNPVEMSNHMNAVERIVNLRGGFHTFQQDGTMAARLTLFDSMIAVQTGKPPRFPTVDYLVARPVSSRTEQRMFHHESPLFGWGNFANIITYHKDQDMIISLMENLWTLTQKLDAQNFNTALSQPTPVIPFIADPQRYYTTPLLTLPLLSHCTNPSHNHVLETLLSAGVMYSRSLANPAIDFPSAFNERGFQQLCTAFGKCSDDEFWVRYPGILLWVLLIGTAASRAKKQAAFWMFYLSRTGSFTTAETWLMGSAAIRRFLELQIWMRENSLR